jgi:hypothetical protein
MNRLATLIAVAALGAGATWCDAEVVKLQTFIDAGQEVSVSTGVFEDTGSEAIGVGLFNFDTVTEELSWTIVHTGKLMDGIETGAGVFGPASPGANAAQVFDLDLGILKQGSIDLSALDGSRSNDLLANKWYVNIKSDAHPDGEIRGQIFVATEFKPVVVPEPLTLSLLVMSSAVVVPGYRRRRRGA